MIRRIKLEPNPRGEENFLFVNALNEWGEGNTLEPSVNWGSRFSEALRSAIDYAEQHLPWIDEVMRQGEEQEPAVADLDSQVDVCVLIRDQNGHFPWSQTWLLSHTLWSLQAQNNPRWRALVFPVGQASIRGVAAHVMDTYDPRVIVTDLPSEVRNTEGVNTTEGTTDWVLERLGELYPSCAQASYLLATDASIQYEPHAFDLPAETNTTADIIGLNFVSPESMALLDERAGALDWYDRCTRFTKAEPMDLCEAMAPQDGSQDDRLLDLSAALINLPRWLAEDHKFLEAATTYGGPGNNTAAQILPALATRSDMPWDWVAPASGQCDVIHPQTYSACKRKGQIWFDGPDVEGFRGGCHSGLGLQHVYGDANITTNWDYQRFKEADPFCVRFSQTRYEKVVAGKIKPHTPGTPQQDEVPDAGEETSSEAEATASETKVAEGDAEGSKKAEDEAQASS